MKTRWQWLQFHIACKLQLADRDCKIWQTIIYSTTVIDASGCKSFSNQLQSTLYQDAFLLPVDNPLCHWQNSFPQSVRWLSSPFAWLFPLDYRPSQDVLLNAVRWKHNNWVIVLYNVHSQQMHKINNGKIMRSREHSASVDFILV